MATTTAEINGLAKEFTEQWRGELGRIGGYYDDAYSSVDNIDALTDQLGQQFDQFQQTYSPYRDMLLEMSTADAGRRTELADTFMRLATPDLDGAGNRAMAGVAHQSGLAAEQIQRGMTRGGGNPGGSNYQGMLRQNALDTAKNKVLAGTTARNQERTVGINAAATGMQIFDPTRSITAATGIDKISSDLLGNQLQSTTTAAQLRAGMASGRANSIAAPLSDVAGAYQGMALAQSLSDDADQQPPADLGAYRTSGTYNSMAPGIGAWM